VPPPSTFVSLGTSATAVNSGTLTLGSSGALQGGISFTGGTIIGSASVNFPQVVSFGAVSNTSGALPGSSNVTFAGSNGFAFSGGVVLNGLTTVINDTDTGPVVIA